MIATRCDGDPLRRRPVATRCDRWREKKLVAAPLWSSPAGPAEPTERCRRSPDQSSHRHIVSRSCRLAKFDTFWYILCDMKRLIWSEWSEWSWMMCMFDMCSFLLRMVHSLCSIRWAQMTWCISHILVASQNGSQDNAEVRSKISCEQLHIMLASWRICIGFTFRASSMKVVALAYRSRLKVQTPSSNELTDWPLWGPQFYQFPQLQVRTNARASDLPPFSELVSQSTTLVQPFSAFGWLRQASSCWIHLHKCAHCWFPCNTTAASCWLMLILYVCTVCVSISWHIMHDVVRPFSCWPQQSASHHTLHQFENECRPQSCMPQLHDAACFSTLFNSLQNPVGSGHKRLQSLQSLQSHHLGSGTSIFSLANAKTGRVRPLPDPTHPTDPAPTSAWRSDEDQMKIRR